VSDNPAGSSSQSLPAVRPHLPFPGLRLVYSLLFALVAWFVFWIALFVGLLQFVVVAINGQTSDELKRLSVNVLQYLGDLLAYITFVRDEPPFPVGPFPKR
jgi:hypothetical protein